MKMICFIYRWSLSTSETERKEPSPFVRSHLAKCNHCSGYYRQLQSLTDKLSTQAWGGAHLVCRHKAADSRRKPIINTALRAAAMVAVAAMVVVFVNLHLKNQSNMQVETLNTNSQLVIGAQALPQAMIARVSASELLNNQPPAMKVLAKEAFLLVFESFTTATDTLTPTTN